MTLTLTLTLTLDALCAALREFSGLDDLGPEKSHQTRSCPSEMSSSDEDLAEKERTISGDERVKRRKNDRDLVIYIIIFLW